MKSHEETRKVHTVLDHGSIRGMEISRSRSDSRNRRSYFKSQHATRRGV